MKSAACSVPPSEEGQPPSLPRDRVAREDQASEGPEPEHERLMTRK